MPIFRIKSVKIYTGQKNLHENSRGFRDKYEVWMWLPPTVAQLVVLLVDLHHRPPQLVGQASFGGDTKQGGIKADIQARAKLDNQAKSLLMSRFDRFILLIYGLSTSS